jgi:hypothetical protein
LIAGLRRCDTFDPQTTSHTLGGQKVIFGAALVMAFNAQAQVVLDLKWVDGKYPSSPRLVTRGGKSIARACYVQA